MEGMDAAHLEDQLDHPLDQPVEFLNSTGQASTRSSWESKSNPKNVASPLTFPLTLNLILFVFWSIWDMRSMEGLGTWKQLNWIRKGRREKPS
ncbi:unnamed protein product [Microthlaspi erraticum]|uniref:Uncharacterized protein n=1 Tax=Microthlaspi erraticum TaxID=1685480 RepID=A0A6D2JBC4_9BRAS|nr:unnamed protein product [Microthlaspi erraticum]